MVQSCEQVFPLRSPPQEVTCFSSGRVRARTSLTRIYLNIMYNLMHSHTHTRASQCSTSLFLVSPLLSPSLFSLLPSHSSPLPLLPSLPERVHRFRSIQPPNRIYQYIGHRNPHRARCQDLSRQGQSIIERNDGIYHGEPHEEDTRNGRALPVLDVGDGVPCISDREMEDEGEKSGGEEGVGSLVDEGGGDSA